MHVVVVCSSNVARSPTLALLLRERRSDLVVDSAGISPTMAPGKPLARRWRDQLAELGLGSEANAHRSRTLDEVLRTAGTPDLIVALTPYHADRLQRHVGLEGVQLWLVGPVDDPAFGGTGAYERIWPDVVRAVDWLAKEIPHAHS